MNLIKILFIFLVFFSGIFFGVGIMGLVHGVPCPLTPVPCMIFYASTALFFGYYLYRNKDWSLPKFKK